MESPKVNPPTPHNMPKELPEAVAQAVAKNYEGATIKEAYVAEKESGKVYKVILTTKDSQEVTVLMNEKGEEVKE